MKKSTLILFCMALLWSLMGCNGETKGTGGEGGDGGTTATAGAGGTGGTGGDGGGGTGGSGGTTMTTSSTDPGIVLGAPEVCSGNTSIVPGTGQLGFHEEGAFACRRFVPPAGHSHVRSWAPAVGLTMSCLSFPIAASFMAPIDQTSFNATDLMLGYTETQIDENNTEPEIVVDSDVPDGMAFFGCLRLTVDEFGGPSCTTVSTCPDASDPALADMLFSEVKPDKTIDTFPIFNLVRLSVSPTSDLAMQFGNDHSAYNTTATFD